MVCRPQEDQRREPELYTFTAPLLEPVQVVYTPPVPTIPAWIDIPVLITAYTPHDHGDSDHWSTKDYVTSTSKDWRVHPYGVAGDPQALPYGTRVVIPGYMDVSYPNKAWAIDDTGGDMRKSWRRNNIIHLDLRYKTTKSAREWAPGWHTVWVQTDTLSLEKVKELLQYRQRHQPCIF